MPELPEVETIRRGLNQLTLAQEIRGGEVLLKRTLAYPVSVAEFWEGIRGTAIAHWHRRGKYLLAQLERKWPGEHASVAEWLGIHLRMTGQLLWVNPEEPLPKHTRVRLFLGEEKELRFVDTRTFGKWWWIPPDQTPETIMTGLKILGPEPLGADFSPEYLAHKLEHSRRKIKTLLLDQSVVARIGNIYADEVLFQSGIRPDAIASNLNQEQIEKLHLAIQEVLGIALEKGGTTFSDYLNLLGVNGNYGSVAWVYRRPGEPCRVCGTPIEKIKLGGRSTHFCPQCQIC